MLKLLLLATLAIVALATPIETQTTKESENDALSDVPNKEYLYRQKLVYDVLFQYRHPSLMKDLYEIGQNYDLQASISSYNDEESVLTFLKHLEYGVIPHDAIYSVYYYPWETMMVYKVLHHAKDFDTFHKTALYMRNRLNHDLFIYAYYLAVIHRPDTKYLRLPPLYEIAPYMFYNTELLEKAHHFEYFGKKERDSDDQQTYVITYNYSGHYLNDNLDYNNENFVNYLTEDIAWNEYYFYFRNEYPYLLNGEKYGLNSKYRGEEYLFGHKQIIARYNLERFANGLSKVEHFDWHGEFVPGYYPTMSYPNSLPFPMRPWNAQFPKNKYHEIELAIDYDRRIMDAVDSGFVLNKTGENVKIYTSEGLNILGNLIEGNADSCNEQFYGNVDKLSRHILSFNYEPLSKYHIHPSALEQFTTSSRDPAFYRIYEKLLHYYTKYQENQGPYDPEEIQFPELKIKSVNVDELVTLFDTFNSTISNGLISPTKDAADSIRIKARQQRLNHKPFTIEISIDAEKATKAVVKIFLGPKYDLRGEKIEFSKYKEYYYEIDNFVTDLKNDSNRIVRSDEDFSIGDSESTEEYYRRIVKALENDEEFEFKNRIYGFPSRLLLPKGKPEGMPMQLFVYVAPIKGEPLLYKSRVFGNNFIDNRPRGFPLDRPIIGHDYNAPNMHFQEVKIYHLN